MKEDKNIAQKIINAYNATNYYGIDNKMEFKIISPGEIEYYWELQQKHLSNPFAAHGGALAGFMDAILGVTALSISIQNAKLVSTVQFDISYFKPAHLGDKIVGYGSTLFKGNSIIATEGLITVDGASNVIAKGKGTFNAYPVEKSKLYDALKS